MGQYKSNEPAVQGVPASNGAARTAGDSLPLCVDLDGSLLRTDTLAEALIAASRNWRVARRLPALLFSGKAGLKAGLAESVTVDPVLLPFNEAALTFLRAEKAAGRVLVLATAANCRIAEAVNRHLGGLFDEVIASDETSNLRGVAKAEALVARFGENGFTYAGNDRSDLPVWQRAGGAVLVNTRAAVARKAAQYAPIEKTMDESENFLISLLKELRIYQWSKNLLVFVPIFTSGMIFDGAAWLAALFVFFSFCIVASSLYAFNDLCDLDVDRRHVRKRRRPFASGKLSLKIGMVAIPLLLIAGIVLGLWANVLLYVVLYAVMSLAYSMWLKEIQLIDIFLLSALYSIRLFAGGEASGHEISLWLLAFSGFFFFSLAIMKRVVELKAVAAGDMTSNGRRGYRTGDISILQPFSVAAAFVASLILALYVQSEQVVQIYEQPEFLWWSVPILLFWQCRMLLITARGNMTDDPIVYAAKDRVTALVIAGVVLCFLAAR